MSTPEHRPANDAELARLTLNLQLAHEAFIAAEQALKNAEKQYHEHINSQAYQVAL